MSLTSAWSFEAWVKPDEHESGVIMCLCDDDGSESEHELIIQAGSGGRVTVQYDAGGINQKGAATEVLAVDTWAHIAVTSDGSDSIDIYHNGLRVVNDNSINNIDDTISSPNVYIGGHPSTPFSSSDFDGVIDDVRWVSYERQAFAGGLMFSEIIPGSNTIRVYNAGAFTMTLTGVEVYNGATRCAVLSGSLGAGAESSSAISCTIGADDGIYLVDSDGDNTGGSDPGFNEEDKEWIIDGVCWNDDGSTIDGECNSTIDPMIAAGVWGINTAIEDIGGGVELIANGNNDDAVSDWKAIPEFGTLLMPVASVLLIVGYNYRRKNNLEA